MKNEQRKELMIELSTLFADLLKAGFKKEDIKLSLKVGFEAYEKFYKKKNIKTKPKMQVYEINANSKEEAIKQLRKLELDKQVEKDIIKILNAN